VAVKIDWSVDLLAVGLRGTFANGLVQFEPIVKVQSLACRFASHPQRKLSLNSNCITTGHSTLVLELAQRYIELLVTARPHC